MDKIKFLASLDYTPLTTNLSNKLVVKCKNNHIFKRTFAQFLRGQILCNECEKQKKINFCKNNNLKYILESNSILTLQCKSNHTFKRSWLNLNKNTNCPICETQNKIEYIESLGFKVIEFKTFGLVAKCKNNHIFKRDFNNFKKGQHKCPICENENKIDFLNKHNFTILSENLSHNLIVKCKNGHILNKIFDKNANFECFECKKQERIDYLNSLGFTPISNNLNNDLVLKCKNGHIFKRCYGNILKGAILCPLCHPSTSSFENEIANILPKLYIKNDYSILKDKELDFYLPDYNLAIECNGSYWHSTKFKDKFYHLNKTIKCLEKSINLIQIFEYEWYNNKEKWVNIINAYLNNNKPMINTNIHISNLCYDLWDYSEFGYKLIQFDYPKLVNSCWNCGYYIWAKSP